MSREPAGHKRSSAWPHRWGQRFAVMIGMACLCPGQVHAEDGDASTLDNVLQKMNLKTDPGRPPAFVESSRPKRSGDYIPVGTQHPTRPIKVKSLADLKASIADLDAARVRQDKISGRKPPDDSVKPVKNAGPGKPQSILPSGVRQN